MDFDQNEQDLLLTSNFRKTFVSTLRQKNNETKQIEHAQKLLTMTKLNDPDKLLLVHDLNYIFVRHFYDFEHGCLSEKSQFIRSEKTLFFFSDYLLFFSFISSFYEEPPNMKEILNDISSENSQKLFLKHLREPLSPYLFVTFVHNLIDSINLYIKKPEYDSIEFEMVRQLIINSKELFLLENFTQLHKYLFEKVKSHFQSEKKVITNEMRQNYSYFFTYSFFQTIVYASDQFTDRKFTKMTDLIYTSIGTTRDKMEPIRQQFDNENHLLNYHTYIYQRLQCIDKPGSWIHFGKDKKDFYFPAQQRIIFMSKKIGEMIGGTKEPFGNSVIRIQFPPELVGQKVSVSFKYIQQTCTKIPKNAMVECIFPCFKKTHVEITIKVNDKKKSFELPSLENPNPIQGTKMLRFNLKEHAIQIYYKFYKYDEPIKEIHQELDNDPTKVFDFAVEFFIKLYFKMNKSFIVANRNEDEDNWEEVNYEEDQDDNYKNMFETKNLRILQDISGRAFPIDAWLFLCDLAIKYSLPASYFFGRLATKLIKCWCNSQAYINLLCIILFCFYQSLQYADHLDEDETLFKNIMNEIHDSCEKLLMNQLAKPEVYQRPSITALMMLISLSCEETEDVKKANEMVLNAFKKVFLSSFKNINDSIISLLIYDNSENECTSMELFRRVYNDPDNQPFLLGKNNLPLCNIGVESLRNAADLILYRCRSISSFYLESFLPSFANIGDNIMTGMSSIARDIAIAFNKINPCPDPKNLTYFVTTYQQLYQLLGNPDLLNPCNLFGDLVQQLVTNFALNSFDLTSRQILMDNFEMASKKTRTSCSLNDIFMFFKQGFDLITSFDFQKDYVIDLLKIILPFYASVCTNYTDNLLSLASNQFRKYFAPRPNKFVLIPNASLSKKHVDPFPSWCPNITPPKELTFEQIAVIINNLVNFRQRWYKHLSIYKNYFPDKPQIQYAVNIANGKSPFRLSLPKSSDKTADSSTTQSNESINNSNTNDNNSNTNNNNSNNNVKDSNNNVKDSDNNNKGSSVSFPEETLLFNEPFYQHNKKVFFMINFLRIGVSYDVYEIFYPSLWEQKSKITAALSLRESLFSTELTSEGDHISTLCKRACSLFKERLKKTLDFLQISLHIKCIPQLIRGFDAGIMESLIPFAFSSQTKAFHDENKINILFNEIENTCTEILNDIASIGFGAEIIKRSTNMLLYWPYMRSIAPMTLSELKDKLKKKKAKHKEDTYKMMILQIMIQIKSSYLIIPKPVNTNFSFITLEITDL